VHEGHADHQPVPVIRLVCLFQESQNLSYFEAMGHFD
jgi:hypothetical protein